MEDFILKLARRRPILPLQKLALIKVTTMLCNNKRLLRLIVKSVFVRSMRSYFLRLLEKEWTAVESMAKRLISELYISDILKKNLLEMIWPISYEIMLWKERYILYLSINKKYLQHICWTEQGKIDSVKTIQYMLGILPMKLRFKLATTVALSKEMHEMWEEMSNDDKIHFWKTNRECIQPLLFFWSYTISESNNAFHYYMEDALKCAMKFRFMEAIKYYFSTMSEPRKSIVAVSYLEEYLLEDLRVWRFLDEYEIDIIYFLLFQMTENQQRTFEKHFLLPLYLLLNSSETELFLNLFAERIRSLSMDEIKTLLLAIFKNYYLGITDYNYSKLFFDCWRMVPDSAKELIANSRLGGEILYELIVVNFPFLLEKGSHEKISELLSSPANTNSSSTRFGFNRGRWEFLKTIILEGIVSVPSLKRYGRHYGKIWLKKMVLDRDIQHRVIRFVRYVQKKMPLIVIK